MDCRIFYALGTYVVSGKILYEGYCPFTWDKREKGMSAWEGSWRIIYKDVDPDRRFKVVNVESYCIFIIRQGSPVGIIVEEINARDQEI